MAQYQCAVCKKTTRLTVVVQVQARLIQEGDNFQTDIDGGDHEWDESSLMTCACGHTGKSMAFINRD
jgi:hypothetical protein